ncbi:MAG: hypothetical protein IJ151_01655 [Bacteroidales bacterium]|nr:hypothetical protein [Bacteroidales bacterium]
MENKSYAIQLWEARNGKGDFTEGNDLFNFHILDYFIFSIIGGILFTLRSMGVFSKRK